jgi:hypothetical protein
MNDLLFKHPSEDVRKAAVRLLDALCSWERSTGRKNLVIIKDGIGCDYRSLSGSPLPPDVSDSQALEAYENMP